MKHATFHRGFLWAALAAALGAGFPVGAHLTFVMGFGFPLGLGYGSFVQTHGHVQLMGWTGLMVMGISLHFMPRLAGIPLAHPQWRSYIVWLMGAGLAMRSLGHAVLPYLAVHPTYTVVAWGLVLSGLLEWCAVVGYVGILCALLRGVGDVNQRPALLAVRPYFGMMVGGWITYASLNVWLLVQMVLSKAVMLQPAWNLWAVQSFLELALLPVAWAFSLRLLPLYLRLPPVDWSTRGVAHTYLIAVALHLLPNLPPLLPQIPRLLTGVAHGGAILKAAVVLWFVWKLAGLRRHRLPRTVQRQLQPDPERRPTQPGGPDNGAFGRFERLVYAAYSWLILAACAEAASALAMSLGAPALISGSAVLHMYLMGFISLLIFAMAVRLLPGFMHKRRVARPGLVEATFWLGNAATLCRVVWFVLPAGLWPLFPGVYVGARMAFAISGLLGLAAVLALAVNLWQTSRGA